MTAFWYRYEDIVYSAGVDEFGDPLRERGELHIVLYKFAVLSETPKGVWVEGHYGRRFVLRDARKRYACPSIRDAADSFRARKTAQARIFRARADRAEEALRTLSAHHWGIDADQSAAEDAEPGNRTAASA